ncbi:acyl-CoA dehydrogenase [Stenotrophomonas rhizophila]|uniref:acyl-CoA dehydrogenase n=1 Tax=Stenotrophomonas rhizophila TaxID=216778 RepID=UPI001E398654|nr:acyl-CoA dehydrogenase [Stenotrophomonas rhizophila]MCC7633995.1 acyl-CoA dehydrogenase [Stenotrophomonas rhizophila]MCC7663329.1 acyl-CoA dehydrogenase [Stenotrophomonas rhizophila]
MDRLSDHAAPALEADARQVLARQPTLPLPGRGHTLERWRALAGIAGRDLCVAKVVEAHYDAQAILADLHAEPLGPGVLAAVWAAEGPQATLRFDAGSGTVTGIKPWCSGAGLVDEALVTAGSGQDAQLLRIRADAAGIRPRPQTWHATGMGGIPSGSVEFTAVHAEPVGTPGGYLARPGFWHGGAGIAACWYGAAVALAAPLQCSPRVAADAQTAALLGQVDMTLQAAAALMRELATGIDAMPAQPHQAEVIRVRSVVERACTQVLDAVGRALGPAPMCLDPVHATRWSDLTVFIRQSHADRDWAELGRAIQTREQPWTL